MADRGRYGGPRFVLLDDDYKVWATYQRAQLKKEKLWAAVVTDRAAYSSDDKKSDPVVDAWDAMNEAALATMQMSVKPVHLNQGLSEYGFLAVSGPEYGYNPEYVAEYSSMIVH